MSTLIRPHHPALQANVSQLLLHVAHGKQDNAEALVRSNPDLLLHRGQVTDYSNRVFENITAFQYALWAYDWHMWAMLERYLPQLAAREQLLDLERNGTPHDTHYNFNELITALEAYINNYSQLLTLGNWDGLDKLWKIDVGGAQCRVPVHVAQEYCRPDRSFHPTPNFKEPTLLRGELWIVTESAAGIPYELRWFPLSGNLSTLFAVLRRNSHVACGEPGGARRLDHWVHIDLLALTELYKARTSQYAALKRQLGI